MTGSIVCRTSIPTSIGSSTILLPATVRELRAVIAASDAVLISSPEYAHGVPGLLKNALDWLVGGAEMVGKRVALLNTAPHATHAQASLAETLRTMSVELVQIDAVQMPRGATDARRTVGRPSTDDAAGAPSESPAAR